MVYVPYWFNNEGKSVLMVRTPAEATVVAGELRRLVRAVDPAVAIGSVVASLLFKVRASDPLVIAGVVALVGAVGTLAAATAARQGLRIDPAAALRDD